VVFWYPRYDSEVPGIGWKDDVVKDGRGLSLFMDQSEGSSDGLSEVEGEKGG
jgi:hypothetical protein